MQEKKSYTLIYATLCGVGHKKVKLFKALQLIPSVGIGSCLDVLVTSQTSVRAVASIPSRFLGPIPAQVSQTNVADSTNRNGHLGGPVARQFLRLRNLRANKHLLFQASHIRKTPHHSAIAFGTQISSRLTRNA